VRSAMMFSGQTGWGKSISETINYIEANMA
jgi:hypothetical protein